MNHRTTTWNAKRKVKMSKLDGRGRANDGKGRAGRTLIQNVQHDYRHEHVGGTCARERRREGERRCVRLHATATSEPNE